MIVRDFLQWIRTAPASDRAEATSALARAYLYSDLSPDDLGAAEGAMLMLLDDASPLVRRALADALAASPDAPPAIVLALAADQPQIAAPVLRAVAALRRCRPGRCGGDRRARRSRPRSPAAPALPRSVAAAIAEVGTAEACLVLVENCDADIAPFSLDRIVERFGHLAAIREALLARDDIPAADPADAGRQAVGDAGRLRRRRANGSTRIMPGASRARPARRRPSTHRRGCAGDAKCGPLIRHLRVSGQLTAGLILRALLSGNVVLFEEALAELAGMPVARVSGLVHDRGTRRLAGAVRQGAGCRPRPILRSRKRSRRCAKAASSASRAARRGSSGA